MSAVMSSILPQRAAPAPAVAAGPVSAVVMIPTFRRPAMLAATLDSLARQQAATPFAIVVVDNDAAGREGLATAEAAFAAGSLEGLALTEPRQGNCHAINAALAAALAHYPQARYLLMIDDDEIASPFWLQRLVDAAERHGADVVGGPVWPVFAGAVPPRVAAHPVFRPAFAESGPVPMIYGSGNFLIRRSALARLAEPAFDTRFNFLGGGDTDFFTRCRRAGLSFHWESSAHIRETVPATRPTTGWILRRSLRIGAINYLIDRRGAATLAHRLRVGAKNAALLPVSLTRAARDLAHGRGLFPASHHVVVAFGRILASLGVETEQYRAR